MQQQEKMTGIVAEAARDIAQAEAEEPKGESVVAVVAVAAAAVAVAAAAVVAAVVVLDASEAAA